MPDIKITEPEWFEFPDAEVMARLIRRGVDPVTAKGWIRDRVMPYAVDEIGAVLNAVYKDDKDEVIRHEIPLDRRPRR